MNYNEANALLQGRNYNSRKLANNTYLHRHYAGDSAISVRLHNTDVVTFYPDGSAEYNSGGWHTFTTKDRMNHFGLDALSIYQKNFDWFFVINRDWASPIPYRDGMRFDPARETFFDAEGGAQ